MYVENPWTSFLACCSDSRFMSFSCFVTEFLERGDLFSVLRNPENKLTWAKPLLRMTIDTSRGMAYLHSMKPPIIHRDLKSMNILVRYVPPMFT